jgi:hypothetical protein
MQEIKEEWRNEKKKYRRQQRGIKQGQFIIPLEAELCIVKSKVSGD